MASSREEGAHPVAARSGRQDGWRPAGQWGGGGRSWRPAAGLLGTRASSPLSSFPRKRESRCPGNAGVPPASGGCDPTVVRLRARRPRSQGAVRSQERRRMSEAHGRRSADRPAVGDLGGPRRMLWERRGLRTRASRPPSSFPRKRESKRPGNGVSRERGGEGGPDRTLGHGLLGTRALSGGPCARPRAPGEWA